MPNIRTKTAAFAALVIPSLSVLAGGSGENAVLLVDPNDATSMWLGNYYKNARGIPDRNILYMAPGAVNHAAFRAVNLPALAGAVAGIEDHADYILIAPTPTFFVSAPGMINDTCWPVTRFSITGAYATAFVTADFVGGASQALPNRYYSSANSAVAFDSQTTWLGGASSTDAAARRYYAAGLIGYTGERGNTPEQIIAMIDRGIAVEGTRPAGTIYLMNNTDDPDRNVRSVQFSTVRSTIINSLGRTCEILPGKLPWTRTDCAGIVSGWPTTDLLGANIAIVPGAFCDHLTSYACTFDIPDQNKASEWITKGASGTNGTVEEPCNYPGKFPQSRLHVWYLQGMTLGESYLRSMQYTPFQNLLLGDALARPFAYVPAVAVAGIPGGPASGTVVLTPTSSTANPRAAMASYDLLIDGEFKGSTSVGGTFTVDTAGLEDGWHDVRVLAYDNTLNKTTGRWAGSMTTRNRGRSVSAIGTASGALSDDFAFVVGASGLPVREIQLIQNGRVIASGADSGAIVVKGRTLGAGPSNVHARAVFVDGRMSQSPPVAVNVQPATGSGTFPTPEAFSYLKRGAPGSALVVELPAVFSDDPASASYQVVGGPTKATVIGGAGAYRVLMPSAGASGDDAMEFRVTTPSGASGTARVVIRWGAVCPADFNGDGFVDFFDYDDFVGCFESGTCPPGTTSDFNGDGFTDFFDYDQFVAAFGAGC